MNATRLNEMIDAILDSIMPFLSRNGEEYQFIDPNDHVEITAHYGTSHFGTALIIIGRQRNDTELMSIGVNLLTSYCNNWGSYSSAADFHADFNLFALSLAVDVLERSDGWEDSIKHLKQVILTAQDNIHETVNWLPMRCYVNMKRYSWTNDGKYKEKVANLLKHINQATNCDGTIEDHLPYGESYNLQYNVSTVALLQLLRASGENIDIGKQINALINLISPDGDINYFGRGTNQIFAWGPWIYLLESTDNQIIASSALDYLENRLPKSLKNYNLLLNGIPGDSKYLWWDYHYFSVYAAHLLLWFALAVDSSWKKAIAIQNKRIDFNSIHLYSTEQWVCTIFDGRQRYLSERGPAIELIWSKKYGTLLKGCFGPWGGSFGNKWNYGGGAIHNYCGLFEIKDKPLPGIEKIRKKLHINKQVEFCHEIHPLFCNTKVSFQNDQISIIFELPKEMNAYINIPIFEDCGITLRNIGICADGKQIPCFVSMRIVNQYGWSSIIQSRKEQAKKWVLTINM